MNKESQILASLKHEIQSSLRVANSRETRRLSREFKDLNETTTATATGTSKTLKVYLNKTTPRHVNQAFNLYISLPSLHNYDVKWPNFELTWEREQQGDKVYFLSLTLDTVPSLQFQPNFPTFK